MIDSSFSSSSEEEICQEITSITLNQMTMTEPCYNNTSVEPVCDVIQLVNSTSNISLATIIVRRRVVEVEGNDVEFDDDDESDIQTSDPKVEEDTKLEEVEPEFDDGVNAYFDTSLRCCLRNKFI